MYVKWLRRQILCTYCNWVDLTLPPPSRQSPCYAVKCVLLLQLISRTTGAGCSMDHASGMNYPTTTASGTWTTRGGISSYGWDSRQPIDPCSRCTNVPPPLPGSQFTTQSHDVSYNANDRIGSVSGYVSSNRVGVDYGSDNRGSSHGSNNRGNSYGSDNQGSSYGSDKRGNGYGSDNRITGFGSDSRVNVYYNTNNHLNNYNPNGQNMGGNGGYISGTKYGGNSYVDDNRVNVYNGYNSNRNPDYRGNGYDNLSPEWDRRHNNKKGSGSGNGGGGGYYQGTSYPVSNMAFGQVAYNNMQGGNNYIQRPSNDRWGIKGAYPVKIESPGYWQSQPPKDIGWDEDSKRVGVVAGWIGGPNKFESAKPSQGYGTQQSNDKYETNKHSQGYSTHQANDKNDDDYFNKGTGYDNSDRKKPVAGGWGGSGSYEVVKMNNGYKYIDKNNNNDYGSMYGNNFGYGGQSYNNKPSQDYGSKPLNVEQNRPNYSHDKHIYSQSSMNNYDQSHMQHHGKPSGNDNYRPPLHDYGSSLPSQSWSTPRPNGYEVTTSRPPMAWGSQKPSYPVIASHPTQHWGENSFNEYSGGGGGGGGGGSGVWVSGINRPGGNDFMRPDGYGSLKPNDYGSFRPDGHGFLKPYDYGSLRPDSYGSSNHGTGGDGGVGGGGGRPDYGSARPFVGSLHHASIMVSDYDNQRPDFSGYSDNINGGGSGGRPQRPGYDNDRPFVMNGNEMYGSQQQTGSVYEKGYASNWEYHPNSMRGQSSGGGVGGGGGGGGGWNNDQPRDYLQRRPDGDVLQSGSNHRPSESTPLHYNGHSGIGASTDNGFLYKSPATGGNSVSSSTTPMPATDSL